MRGIIPYLALVSLATADEPSFQRDVLPILSDNCFACHGPDEENNKSELRLDRPEDAHGKIKDSDLRMLVPGKPEESAFWQRVISKDPEEVMPPPESHLKLSDSDKDILKRWIESGAEYEKHWAFVELPSEVPAPEVSDKAWAANPIDKFVIARLEKEAIKPSEDAKPLRWLRRASLDLTGLPPSPELIESFRKEFIANEEEARSKAVDQLLSMPAYGEHMAVDWLDAARYADSYGYQSDQLNTQWPYRDWVIDSFNNNLSYDKFLTWQLAGDLLPNATREQKLATAFNRLHRLTNEGGSISEEWMAENAADRVHTFGTAFLALTMECSRCHDHKYDPIPMRDYYSLSAFFNSIDENGLYDNTGKVPSPTLGLPTDEEEKQLEEARNRMAQAAYAHDESITGARDRFSEWLAKSPAKAIIPDLEAHYTFDSAENNKLKNHAEKGTGEGKLGGASTEARGEGLALVLDGDHGPKFPDNGKFDRWTPFTIGLNIKDTVRHSLPGVIIHKTFGTDVGYNGYDLMLDQGYLEARLFRIWPGNGIGVRTLEPIPQNQWKHVTLTYDGSSTAAGLKIFVDGQEVATEVLRDKIFKNVMAKYWGGGNMTIGERFRGRGFAGGRVDDLTIHQRALTSLEVGQIADLQTLEKALSAKNSDDDKLFDYYCSAIDETCRATAGELEKERHEFVNAENAIFEIPVMEEMPEPRETHVLARGAYDAETDESTRVTRQTPEALPPMQARGETPDRLDLANWLTEPSHPLTSRVYVNRLWAHFFGQGLVSTPENFGLQSSPPSHPELLDWLARDFIDNGWDIKHFCKQIVLSRTYRQNSALRPDLADRDPENILLARGPAYRLSSEQIRDLALSSSGLLDREKGGPPVSPYQPGKDLWRESNGMSPAYKQSTGKALHRRSIYSVWKRTAPLPNMVAFDSPSREMCVVSRSRTSTPLQALVLLNDVQFVEAARNLAERVHNDSIAQEIEDAFLLVCGREPRAEESEILEKLHASEMERFKNEPKEAAKLISHGETKADSKLPVDHLAASTSVCLAILNLDAAIWKR